MTSNGCASCPCLSPNTMFGAPWTFLMAVDDHALFGEENPQRGLIESITPAYSRFAVEGFVVAHLTQPFAGPKKLMRQFLGR
jgi:hypothetical protein